MAVEALFNSTYTDLVTKARIQSATDDQTTALVNMAVSEVRVGFYKELGADRVSEILSNPMVDNPSTEGELLRVNASNTEVLWLTYLLLPRLPTNYMSSAHLTSMSFNEEPLTREADNIKKNLELLKSQIDSGLAALVAVPEDYESKTFKATYSVSSPVQLIGDTFPGQLGAHWK